MIKYPVATDTLKPEVKVSYHESEREILLASSIHEDNREIACDSPPLMLSPVIEPNSGPLVSDFNLSVEPTSHEMNGIHHDSEIEKVFDKQTDDISITENETLTSLGLPQEISTAIKENHKELANSMKHDQFSFHKADFKSLTEKENKIDHTLESILLTHDIKKECIQKEISTAIDHLLELRNRIKKMSDSLRFKQIEILKKSITNLVSYSDIEIRNLSWQSVLDPKISLTTEQRLCLSSNLFRLKSMDRSFMDDENETEDESEIREANKRFAPGQSKEIYWKQKWLKLQIEEINNRLKIQEMELDNITSQKKIHRNMDDKSVDGETCRRVIPIEKFSKVPLQIRKRKKVSSESFQVYANLLSIPEEIHPVKRIKKTNKLTREKSRPKEKEKSKDKDKDKDKDKENEKEKEKEKEKERNRERMKEKIREKEKEKEEKEKLKEKMKKEPDSPSSPSSPKSPSSSKLTGKLARKRRSSEMYDINNLVIPSTTSYHVSITPVEYKQIYTPSWRILSDSPDVKNKTEIKYDIKLPENSFDEDEDTSDEVFERRHTGFEKLERQGKSLDVLSLGKKRDSLNQSEIEKSPLEKHKASRKSSTPN